MLSRTELISKLRRAGLDPAQIVVLLELRSALAGCSTVLDVGCGPNSALQHFGLERLVGLEGWPPSVETARRNRTHHEIIPGDVRAIEQMIRPRQFEACVALDVIEHLKKEEGFKFLEALERCASRKVILLTPNGFLPQGHTDTDDLQSHHSGWDPAEMRTRGYRVVGALGPKKLRGEYHKLRYQPRLLWAMISLAAQLGWNRWQPNSAAAIICAKTL